MCVCTLFTALRDKIAEWETRLFVLFLCCANSFPFILIRTHSRPSRQSRRC